MKGSKTKSNQLVDSPSYSTHIRRAGGSRADTPCSDGKSPAADRSAPRLTTPDYSKVKVLRAQPNSANGSSSNSANAIIPIEGKSPFPVPPTTVHAKETTPASRKQPQVQQAPVRYVPGSASVVRLIDRQIKLCPSELRKLLSDHPLSLVISAVGRSGVGKSTLLSQFSLEPQKAFPPRSKVDDYQRVFSVDAMVSQGGRFILLDVQACGASKGVFQMTTSTTKSIAMPRPSTLGADGVSVDLLNAQITAWLLTVSDIVLVVSDTLDVELMQCVRAAQELAVQTPQVQGLAHIVFVRNKVPPSKFVPSVYKHHVDFVHQSQSDWASISQNSKGSGGHDKLLQVIQEMQSPLPKDLACLSLTCILPRFESQERSNAMRTHSRTITSDEQSSYCANVWFLPDFREAADEYPLPFGLVMSAMRDQLIQVRRSRTILESDWLKPAMQFWEYIKRSGYLLGA